MVIYYAACALITLVALVILLCNFRSGRINFYFLILMLLMTFSNAGYLAVALSTSVEEAVLANKICYLDGCFIQPITLLLICAIANIKLPKWLSFAVGVISFAMYAMVLSIGYSDIYYEDIWLERYGGATVLGHTYGSGHDLFYVMLVGHVLAQIGLLIYCFAKKKAVSRKSLWSLMILETVSVVSFLVGNFIEAEIEVLTVNYCINSWVLLYMYHRGMMYSLNDNIANTFSDEQKHCYIMFDKGMNYLGSSDNALSLFPELSECTVDKHLVTAGQLGLVSGWLKRYIQNQESGFSYEWDSRHYECEIKDILYENRTCGYMIELREDTDKWMYLQLLAKHNAELERFQSELEKKVSEQTAEIKAQDIALKELFMQTVTALSGAVDAKDRYTSGHSKRVAEYSRAIAARMGKSESEQEEIYRAGLLHDVGKIRVPVEIINKAGKLTDEEYDIIKLHPTAGYHILRGISGSYVIATAAKYHHERYDGRGYPNGIAGENIPEAARILAVADSYDAMASNRSYRKALPQDVVRSEIEKGKGTQFDPVVAEIMLQMIDEDTQYSMKQIDADNKSVLVVDDDLLNHKIISRIMQDEPMYTLAYASSGFEALEMIEKQNYDLILLDVLMPGIDGLETLRRLRRHYSTPVVIMTGDKTLVSSSEYTELGCEDYITKPFLPNLMKEVIYSAVGKSVPSTTVEVRN